MALSNASSVQQSKSGDDLDINEISDEEQFDEDYKKLLQESVRMSKISEKSVRKEFPPGTLNIAYRSMRK